MREITAGICERLALIRREQYGSRGRSRFARDLGIRPSTYSHYETDRLPPADILLRAARLTRTRVEWLITGEGEPADTPLNTPRAYVDRLTDRLHQLLQSRPELLPQVDAFLRVMEVAQVNRRPPVTDRPAGNPRHLTELIPVVGSTSAGTARYWHERPESRDGPQADARLEALIGACTGPAVETAARLGSTGGDGPVSLVQMSHPDDRGVLEFLSATDIKRTHPDCVAWRIDGESMSPRYQDGDLVLTSPQQPAQSGHPCVARQRGQLGVNCKLFQQRGATTWLIPIHPDYPTQELPTADIVWAWQVLASVRLLPRGATD